MLGMTYIYNGQKEFGMHISRRCWENIVCKWRYNWNVPNTIDQGSTNTGEAWHGQDYYQNMMLWSLPAALENKSFDAPVRPGGLAYRVMKAARK